MSCGSVCTPSQDPLALLGKSDAWHANCIQPRCKYRQKAPAWRCCRCRAVNHLVDQCFRDGYAYGKVSGGCTKMPVDKDGKPRLT